jgi:hypothetical protein
MYDLVNSVLTTDSMQKYFKEHNLLRKLLFTLSMCISGYLFASLYLISNYFISVVLINRGCLTGTILMQIYPLSLIFIGTK